MNCRKFPPFKKTQGLRYHPSSKHFTRLSTSHHFYLILSTDLLGRSCYPHFTKGKNKTWSVDHTVSDRTRIWIQACLLGLWCRKGCTYSRSFPILKLDPSKLINLNLNLAQSKKKVGWIPIASLKDREKGLGVYELSLSPWIQHHFEEIQRPNAAGFCLVIWGTVLSSYTLRCHQGSHIWNSSLSLLFLFHSSWFTWIPSLSFIFPTSHWKSKKKLNGMAWTRES